jgi:hypothetical protein
MGAIMEPLVALLKALEPALTDTGPTPAMQALGDNIQQLKDVVQALEAAPGSQADILHTDRTNRAAFGLAGACLDARIHPEIITHVLLYYWLRLSTINAYVPEPFFRKLERHWEIVAEHVGAFVAQRARRTRR